jgi:hypothetical protein
MSGGRENQNNPTFEDVIATLFRRFSCEEIQTVHPGKIVRYNPKTQEADVELTVVRNYTNGDEVRLPIATSVPVVQYRTTTAMIKLPVSIGDRVLVIFSKSSLDSFLSTGSSAKYSAGSQFQLSDGIAIPGLFPFSEPNSSGEPDDLEIINRSQKITIKSSGDIEIGGVDLKKLVTEEFVAEFEGHSHNYFGVPTGAFSTSTPVKAVGVTPATPPVGTAPPNLFASEITEAQLTSKTRAQ